MALQEPIAPQEVAKPAVELRIDTVIFRFGTGDQYAFASSSLLDEDGKIVEAPTVQFTEEELAGWGSDDTELLVLVKAKLGLS
jgi:hypothetical protein